MIPSAHPILFPMTNYDGPWKETLDTFCAAAIEFFFPRIHSDIDWQRGYETLDTELQRIVSDSAWGKGIVDKLIKVYLRSGAETWLLLHIEFQAPAEAGFPLRMYAYHCGIFLRYNQEVIRKLYKLIDWMMTLPGDLQQLFRDDFYRFEEEKRMPYIISTELLARKEGRQEGREEGAEETLKKAIDKVLHFISAKQARASASKLPGSRMLRHLKSSSTRYCEAVPLRK